jgi:hypothetical protein
MTFLREYSMAIKARSIVEIMGGPKEHVAKAMEVVLQKLKEHKDIKVLKKEIFDPKEVEGKKPLWTMFTELDLEFTDVQDVFGFCFDFMPSSVEIYDPVQVSLGLEPMNNMFNELLAKMHQYDMAVKSIYAQNIMLKRKYGVEDEVTTGKQEESKEDKK